MLSIGSVGSFASILSVGSSASIGSIGSVASAFSASSAASAGVDHVPRRASARSCPRATRAVSWGRDGPGRRGRGRWSQGGVVLALVAVHTRGRPTGVARVSAGPRSRPASRWASRWASPSSRGRGARCAPGRTARSRRWPHRWTRAGVEVQGEATGAHLLHLSVAVACSNDTYREAEALGVPGARRAGSGRPAGSGRTGPRRASSYAVEVDSPDDPAAVDALVTSRGPRSRDPPRAARGARR